MLSNSARGKELIAEAKLVWPHQFPSTYFPTPILHLSTPLTLPLSLSDSTTSYSDSLIHPSLDVQSLGGIPSTALKKKRSPPSEEIVSEDESLGLGIDNISVSATSIRNANTECGLIRRVGPIG